MIRWWSLLEMNSKFKGLNCKETVRQHFPSLIIPNIIMVIFLCVKFHSNQFMHLEHEMIKWWYLHEITSTFKDHNLQELFDTVLNPSCQSAYWNLFCARYQLNQFMCIVGVGWQDKSLYLANNCKFKGYKLLQKVSKNVLLPSCMSTYCNRCYKFQSNLFLHKERMVSDWNGL